MLHTRNLHPTFGVEILEINLNDPETQNLANEIVTAFYKYSLLLFRNQSLSPQDLIVWSEKIGVLEKHSDSKYLLDGYPGIIIVGNLTENGKMKSLFLNSAIEWHFDYAQAKHPSLGSLFYAVEVPPSEGDTWYADTISAYDSLSEERKFYLDSLVGEFSYEYLDNHLRSMDPTRPPLSSEMKAQWPPVKHHIVAKHPVTNKKAILISPELMSGIDGLDQNATQKTVNELLEYVVQDKFLYKHKWEKGDLIMFDNRAMIHTATPFETNKYLRVMYRTTIMYESESNNRI